MSDEEPSLARKKAKSEDQSVELLPQEKLLSVLPRPPTPPDANSLKLFWFGHLTQLLQKCPEFEGKQVNLMADVKDAELNFSPGERAKAEKKSSRHTKQNYFIREQFSNKIFFVKSHSNAAKIAGELYIYKELKKAELNCIKSPLFGWKGRPDADMKSEWGFFVMECITSPISLQAIISSKKKKTPLLDDVLVLQGLLTILENLAKVDPAGHSSTYLHHADFNASQVVYSLTDKSWWLIDFGNSELVFNVEFDLGLGEKYIGPFKISMNNSSAPSGDEKSTIKDVFSKAITDKKTKKRVKKLKEETFRGYYIEITNILLELQIVSEKS